MNDQLERYNARRSACTMADGTRPYGWWKRYQQHIGGAKMITEAEIQREAARLAKAQAARTGGDE